jgi:hypothetical protein
MKVNIFKKIGRDLIKLFGRKAKTELNRNAAIKPLGGNEKLKLNDPSPRKPNGLSSNVSNEFSPRFFRFEPPIVIPKRPARETHSKIRGLKPRTHYEKILWSNHGPVELKKPEND